MKSYRSSEVKNSEFSYSLCFSAWSFLHWLALSSYSHIGSVSVGINGYSPCLAGLSQGGIKKVPVALPCNWQYLLQTYSKEWVPFELQEKPRASELAEELFSPPSKPWRASSRILPPKIARHEAGAFTPSLGRCISQSNHLTSAISAKRNKHRCKGKFLYKKNPACWSILGWGQAPFPPWVPAVSIHTKERDKRSKFSAPTTEPSLTYQKEKEADKMKDVTSLSSGNRAL